MLFSLSHTQIEDDSGSTRALSTEEQKKAFRKDSRKKHTMMCDEAFAVEDNAEDSATPHDSASSEEFATGASTSARYANESDDDLKNLSIHQRLYGQGGAFAPMENDMMDDDDFDDDDDVHVTSSRRGMQRHSAFNGVAGGSGGYEGSRYSSYGGQSSYGSSNVRNTGSNIYPRSSGSTNTYTMGSLERGGSYEREVQFRSSSEYNQRRTYGTMNAGSSGVRPDAGVNFGLKASSNVRVEKSESTNRPLNTPRFGTTLNQKEFTRKTMGLVDGSDEWRKERAENMPTAEPISSHEGSAKKKKKKNKKGEFWFRAMIYSGIGAIRNPGFVITFM